MILVLGSRLGFNTTFYSYENLNEKASIIQCEIDLNSIGRYFPVEVGIHADAKTVTDELYKMLETHKSKKEVQDWLDQFKDNRKNYFEKRDADADTESVPILPSGLLLIAIVRAPFLSASSNTLHEKGVFPLAAKPITTSFEFMNFFEPIVVLTSTMTSRQNIMLLEAASSCR